MSIPVLPDVGVPPAYGLSGGGTFNVHRVKLGDNYEQRAPAGINSAARRWSVSWKDLTKAQADEIYEFLMDRLGAYGFLWYEPESDAFHKVTCPDVPKWTADDYDHYSVQAELHEDFTP